jgi:(2R)-ethylmalonyl-CoA mutase
MQTHPQTKAPWIIRTYAGFGTAYDSNKRFRENLAKGQTGLSVAFDLPTQNGYDPDAPMSAGEVGGTGVSIAQLGDMRTLFDEIDLARVNTSMTINATAPFILALYLALAEERGIDWSTLRGTVQNDLMKEFVARGTSIFCPEFSLRLSTDLITFCAEHVPHWNPINICGYHYMESGAGPEEEIGYAIGNAMLVLDEIEPELSAQAFASVVRRISFFINSGIELVPEICKVRAYARLWKRVCHEEYGIPDVPFRAGCQVRSLSLTASQPENNIVRIALQALPVILSANARVNGLQLPGFREALGLPDHMEQALSLRTQQILMHETKIADYPDIFEGNPVIEDLTRSMMDSAYDIAQRLRSAGYENAAAIINTELTRAILRRQERIESGEDIVVGVNRFCDPVGLSEQLHPAPAAGRDMDFEKQRADEVESWKALRNPQKWKQAKERLEAAARNGGNIMEASVDFARAGGTVGEWTSTLELVSDGRFKIPLDLSVPSVVSPNGHGHGTRVVIGKAGLDGHTNAVKLLAIGCKNAGMEVIFAGTRVSPATLIKSAIEEDADVLAVSCLSGAHLRIAHELACLKRKLELHSLRIVMGGIIPPQDIQTMLDKGIDLVIPSDALPINEIVGKIAALSKTVT